MAVDPLSPATRATKRNLLVASVMAITYRAFDVAIDKIPVAGLALTFDNRVFTFLLIATLLYLTGTFALYYFIDIRNVQMTQHQTTKEESFESELSDFHRKHADRVVNRIRKKLPAGIVLILHDSSSIASLFRKLEHPTNDLDSILLLLPSSFTLHEPTETPPNSLRALDREQSAEIFQIADRAFASAMTSYARVHQWHSGRLAISLYSVRSIYFIRDYLVDGLLPLVLAFVAFAALFQVVNLHWLRNLIPMPTG